MKVNRTQSRGHFSLGDCIEKGSQFFSIVTTSASFDDHPAFLRMLDQSTEIKVDRECAEWLAGELSQPFPHAWPIG